MKNIFHGVPTVKEYQELCEESGLTSPVEEFAAAALANSLFGVTLRGEDSEIIGMGRVIGDGACFFQIVDVLIKPAFKETDAGDLLMLEILEYLRQNAPLKAQILTVSDVPGLKLYQKHGFKLIYPDFYGMTLTRDTLTTKQMER